MILTLTVFLPLLGAILVGFLPKDDLKMIRYTALGVSLITFVVSVAGILLKFNSDTFHFQFVEYARWMDSAGIHYRMGLDGISIWLVLLTTFLSVISIWFSFYVKERVKAYMAAILVLETAMLGVFCSLDLILFYTFFEASLVPMWLLISIWGGSNRKYAGLKFFIFTFAGSIFMLLGIIMMAWLNSKVNGGTWSFSLVDIQSNVANGSLWASAIGLQPLIFWSFMIAFLVKCPAFPFHTWLPDAHVEAPTAGSIILAGVLLKMGTYGFLRFVLPFFPEAVLQYLPFIMLIAVVGIIYGAIVAAVQPDVKKLVAYSSVSHMGFVMLGIFSLSHMGMMGGAMQQLNHGISTGALFLLVGLIYERRHTRNFADYGGLKTQMPIFSAIFLIIMLSSVGLPGTNGFIGEFLALFGAMQSAWVGLGGLSYWLVVLAGTGVILAAVYLLWMFQKVFYGPNTNPENQRLKDIKPWEIAMAGSLVVLVFIGGIFPNIFLKPMERSITATRMMALYPAGQRPSWSEVTQDIDAGGNLASEGGLVAPANPYPTTDLVKQIDERGSVGVATKPAEEPGS